MYHSKDKSACPAADSNCYYCNCKGHFARACFTKKEKENQKSHMNDDYLANCSVSDLEYNKLETSCLDASQLVTHSSQLYPLEFTVHDEPLKESDF